MEYSRNNTVPSYTNSRQALPPAPPRYPEGSNSGFDGLERVIIRLYNDPLVDNDTIGPNRVFCLACGSRIEGLGTTYAMGRWDAHKGECKKAQVALKELKEGKRFVPAKRMAILRPEDFVCSEEEKAIGKGMYSERMVRWRQTYAAELQRESLMAQRQPSASSSSSSSVPKESLFATRTLPPLPNRPAIPKDVYASATYSHSSHRY